MFGGRGLQQHGIWLALARDGRWVAITNVHRMEIPDPAAPSRGGLVSGYLRSTLGARAYGESLPPIASRYAGFNLLPGDRSEERRGGTGSGSKCHYRWQPDP